MLAAILGSTIPVAYVLIGAGSARYVARTFDGDDIDRFPAAILIGMFWPVGLIFYIALRGLGGK